MMSGESSRLRPPTMSGRGAVRDLTDLVRRVPAVALAVVAVCAVMLSTLARPRQSPGTPRWLRAASSPALRDSLTPFNVHLLWDRQLGSDTSIAVTWATLAPETSIVTYGVSDTLGFQQPGVMSYVEACGQYVHVTRIGGLLPQTRYYYRCGSPQSWSTLRAFRTALSKGSSEPFTFVAYGDSRTNCEEAEIVANAARSVSPAFVLHAGDFVNVGQDQSQWDAWFNAVDSLVGGCAHMGSVGNHDLRYSGAGLANYTGQFAFPGNEQFYSFDYGNAHFVCIYLPEDSSQVPDTSRQYEWLVNDLEATAADSLMRWKFAWWHVPPYSASAAHWAHNTRVIDQLFPLFQRYGVQVTFQGHSHSYERTYLLKDDSVEQYGPVFADPRGGVVSIVTGGAGAPLYDVGAEWWTAYSARVYHFCKVTVDGGTLHMEAILDDGVTVIDSCTIALNAPLDDLRGSWRFEDGAGTTASDCSAYENDGAVSGATWTDAGESGAALSFDGIDDYVEVANSISLVSATDALTIMAWVKPAAVPAVDQTVLEKWFSDESAANPIHDRSFALMLRPSGEAEFWLSADGSAGSSSSVVSDSAVEAGTWTHIAATFDGATMRVYLGGVADTNAVPFSSRIHPSGAALHVGRLRAIDAAGDQWHAPFEGLIDEVRIYARALSREEIAGEARPWDLCAVCEESELVLHWSPVPFIDSVFVFRGSTAHFTPDLEGYANRVAVLAAGDTSYSSGYGLGDPMTNAFYRLVGYSITCGAMRFSNAVGEFEFSTPGQPAPATRGRPRMPSKANAWSGRQPHEG